MTAAGGLGGGVRVGALMGLALLGFLPMGLALVCTAVSASAGQALIPSPYPDAVPGAAPLDPEPVEPGGPQRIMRDPYPQATGDFSQGNPSIVRRHRHQRLVPSIYRRKYRVDRP